MGTYGYISIIAMVCYAFMLLMFLAAKRNKIVNSFLVVFTYHTFPDTAKSQNKTVICVRKQ